MIPEFFEKLEGTELRNHGGCLFFCLAFWRWLKQNNLPTESFDIVQYDSDGIPTKTNLGFINGEGATAASYHFSWLYEGIEYDGNGKMNGGYAFISKTVLSGLNSTPSMVECFCVKALNENRWNPSFNRKSACEILGQNGIDMGDVV